MRDDKLTLLGKKTEYKQDYAPEVLETFENKHQDRDYWVQFNCPEFTSLCPITSQPDFSEKLPVFLPLEVEFLSILMQIMVCLEQNMSHLQSNVCIIESCNYAFF